jgi:NAD-dependent deacetylase
MAGYERIVILTGAGLSKESGLSTFRDPDGIWAKYDIADVATPEAFARNPEGVLDFYNSRRKGAKGVKPNAAHQALARLEREYPGEVLTVTQNIDPLHEWAGTQNLIHMHGEILKALCAHCGARTPWEEDITVDLACPGCGKTRGMRPDVVWFGEMPYRMD